MESGVEPRPETHYLAYFEGHRTLLFALVFSVSCHIRGNAEVWGNSPAPKYNCSCNKELFYDVLNGLLSVKINRFYNQTKWPVNDFIIKQTRSISGLIFGQDCGRRSGGTCPRCPIDTM